MNKVKKLLRDAANKRPQVVLILLTAAEKKLVNHTKTNLNKYIRILSAIECKSPAVHKQKARVVNAQPVKQNGGSGNDQASSGSESGEDVIKCSLYDKFYLTEASKTRHFKHKHKTKMPCSYKNAIAISPILRHWKIMKNCTVWILQLSTNVINVTTDSSLKLSYKNMLSSTLWRQNINVTNVGRSTEGRMK